MMTDSLVAGTTVLGVSDEAGQGAGITAESLLYRPE